MPLHHIGINVADLKESRDFYLAALKPLGYKIKMEFLDGEVLGFGAGFAPDFWLAGPNAPVVNGSDKRHNKDATGDLSDRTQVEPRAKTGPLHIAFAAKNRAQVRKFYEAAMCVTTFVVGNSLHMLTRLQCCWWHLQWSSWSEARIRFHLLRCLCVGSRGKKH